MEESFSQLSSLTDTWTDYAHLKRDACASLVYTWYRHLLLVTSPFTGITNQHVCLGLSTIKSMGQPLQMYVSRVIGIKLANSHHNSHFSKMASDKPVVFQKEVNNTTRPSLPEPEETSVGVLCHLFEFIQPLWWLSNTSPRPRLLAGLLTLRANGKSATLLCNDQQAPQGQSSPGYFQRAVKSAVVMER